MELSIRPHKGNNFPLHAILLSGEDPALWLSELQRLGIPIAGTNAYTIPGVVPGVIFGCLVIGNFDCAMLKPERNTACQVLYGRLIIPERSALYPLPDQEEILRLCAGRLFFMHPQTGLTELVHLINWRSMFCLPQLLECNIRTPEETIHVPSRIRSFQVKSKPSEKVLEELEKNHFPTAQKFPEKPLTIFERLKLAVYRPLFSNQAEGKMVTISERFPWLKKLKEDHKDLEKRNEKHLDKLLSLFGENIGEALKYAIPLDADGTGRGQANAGFAWLQRWFDFSPGSTSGPPGRGVAVTSDEGFTRLSAQYNAAAQQLISEGDFRKAAFIYMKLLKNHFLGARTLENGKMYAEAGAVYLRYLKDLPKAAACFEKAGMVDKAIEIYKELNDHLKLGDLYRQLQKEESALQYYRLVVEENVGLGKYVTASEICKDRMLDIGLANTYLVQGWREGRDAHKCMTAYFSNFRKSQDLMGAIEQVYATEVQSQNRETYLRVLQELYANRSDVHQTIRDISYEIIVSESEKNPSIISEIRSFNKEDRYIGKDLLRFKTSTQ